MVGMDMDMDMELDIISILKRGKRRQITNFVTFAKKVETCFVVIGVRLPFTYTASKY